jgi:hypothetical protein
MTPCSHVYFYEILKKIAASAITAEEDFRVEDGEKISCEIFVNTWA